MTDFPYHPKNEGIDHINTYSKSQLPLGRMLSNFCHAPMTIPDDGYFASMEGYWFWLPTRDESLRALHGIEAKKIGTKLRKLKGVHCPDFEEKMKFAAQCKLKQNLAILHALKASSLPLVHYYSSKRDNKIIVQPEHGADWLWHHYMVLRAMLRKETPPPFVETKKEIVHKDGTLSLF